MEDYGVVGVSVELWSRIEMPFLKETVADRCHCWVVVSSDKVSNRWCVGSDNGVALFDAGGS